jgi:hypothetical protein
MRGVRGSSVSIARAAEIEAIIDAVTLWAPGRPDVVGLLLVGSCARDAARPSSDVDFVLLSTRPYVAPVDPGTLRVVNDGARALYDPAGLLTALLGACHGTAP